MKPSRKIPIATAAGVLVLLSAAGPVRQAHAGQVDCEIRLATSSSGGRLRIDAINQNKCDDSSANDNIVDGTVDNADLADDAVDSTQIKDGEVKESDLANNAVTAPKIANNAVDSSKIKDGEVNESDLADNAVTAPKIANNAVTARAIANNAVTAPKIANNAVTARAIANNAVTTRAIADKAVTTDKIADNAVTFGKLGAGVRKRITDLEEDVEDANAGVAMAVALASAPIVPGKNASLSIGGGMFKNEYGGAARLAIRLRENAYLTFNGTASTDGLYAAGTGLGIGF